MRRILALLLLLMACEDRNPGPGSLGGRLSRIEDGEPYGSAVVALYELSDLRVVGRQDVDGSGSFFFGGLSPGTYTPVVYAADRVLLHLDRPSYRIYDGVHIELELPMAPIGAYPETGHYLAGQVLDDADDSPIPFVLLEITAPTSPSLELFSEIDGRSGPLTQLSDQAGRFRLGPLQPLNLPDGERMVPHLRVSHPDYEDLARGPWSVDALPGDLTLRMTRGEDSGWVGGIVLSYPDSTPVAGVAVSVEWQADEGRFPKLLPPERIAHTDAEGRFELGGIPPGRHWLLGGFPADDGWVGYGQAVSLADSLLMENPLLISPAIPLLEPPDQAVVDSLVALEWGAHPTAVAYQPSLQRLTDGSRFTPGLIGEIRWIPDDEARPFLAPGGPFLWSVVAFDGLGRDVSVSERPNLFEIRPPATQ